MKDNRFSRRQFMQSMGLLTAASSTSAVQLFLDQFVNGLIYRARAEQGQVTDKRYVLVNSYGAPPRWMFDLFLKPYGGTVVKNLSVASEYVASSGGRYEAAQYKTHLVKGVQAPLIWTQKVASSGGGSRSVSDLMDNMIVLQGMDALNPGHYPAARLINRPLTEYSIDGVLADLTEMPLGGAYVNTLAIFNNFKSKTGKRSKKIDLNNPYNFERAFKTVSPKVGEKYKFEIDRAVASLNKGLEKYKLSLDSLNLDYKSATELMAGKLANFKNDFDALKAKYQGIISSTARMSKTGLKGLTDRPIGSSNTDSRINDPRYAASLGGDDKRIFDQDLRNTLNDKVTVSRLAENFAFAEYLIKNQLSPSVHIRCEYPTKFSSSADNKDFTVTHDQHSWGVMSSVLYTTLYYRMLSACLLELVDAFKSTPYKNSNLFDYTVIRHSAEFGRLPKNDGSGSDHAPESTNHTLLSGMIKGPIVAGNILADPEAKKKSGRVGSWGYKGGLEGQPDKFPTTGYVISSLATLLDIPSPSSNNPSLIIKNSDGTVELNTAYINKTKVIT